MKKSPGVGVGPADAFMCDVVILVTQNTTDFSFQMRQPRHWKAVHLEISDNPLAGKARGSFPSTGSLSAIGDTCHT